MTQDIVITLSPLAYYLGLLVLLGFISISLLDLLLKRARAKHIQERMTFEKQRFQEAVIRTNRLEELLNRYGFDKERFYAELSNLESQAKKAQGEMR